ncbi:PREDICTED: zinc finger protein ZAT9-like [Camelina sativa]|uniref:Zinc finger protein ZAT9-like n=1 Tax=Camelina sativa TaxID=90675 RepID=A0ABM0VY49_CAMSA|nr:PREDICTED: zinc finger protein ZAT9-like [Camelina sativa]
MDDGEEKKFVCMFCNRAFASEKGRGGHIRIHYSNKKDSVDSDRYNGNKKKSLVGRQREKQKQQQQQQQDCTICRKKFVSLKALEDHMACHSEGDAILLDSQSDTDSETTKKRSKKVMRRSSDSESFSNEILSFGSGISQDVGVASYIFMMMKSVENCSYEERHNFVMNSMHEDDFEVVKTKSSSGKKLITISYVKSQVSEKGKVADGDQLRSAEGVILCGSDGFDSDADISVHGSRRNTGSGFNNSMNRFRNGDEGGSKYETDSRADTNSKIHRLRDSKSPEVVKKAGGEEKESKSHECPICFEVFKSVQALDYHVRSHYIGNREHNQVAEMPNKNNLRLVDYSDSDTDDERIET